MTKPLRILFGLTGIALLFGASFCAGYGIVAVLSRLVGGW